MSTTHIAKRLTLDPIRLLVLAGALLAASTADASTNNLLINGSFNAGGVGWTTWGGHTESWGSHWASFEIPSKLNPSSGNYNPALVGVYDGTLQLSVGANGGGWAGANQLVAAAENVTYTLTVQGGAENWWLPTGEIRMIWLDATNAEISRNVVNTTDSIHNPDQYDVGVVYANWTNIATAPIGTKVLKVELANPVGTGSTFFDNANLTAPIDPPVIGNLYPDGTRLLQATNKLSFTATSAAPINGSGVVVTVNGVDVSGSLAIVGSGTTNLSVSYSGLAVNRSYSAVITVTDSVNLTSFKNLSFDTYAPLFTWEAEDYDFSSGQFYNLPTPSGIAAANSYFGLTGTEGVDFHDRNNSGAHDYRAADTMAATVTGEVTRQPFATAGAPDYNVGWFDGAAFTSGNSGLNNYDTGEWLNYTRDLPAGTYNIYGRVANGNGGTATIPLSKVVSGWGTTTQTITELGAFRFPANGWGNYDYVPLTDKFGNRVAVTLSGTNTLRVTAGSGGNLNFFMLLAADTERPTITSVYPDGSTLVQGTNQLTFIASSSTHSIAQSNVVVTLNGVDVSATLAFTGSASSWNVSAPLALNVTNYTAVISVADDVGNTHSTTVHFDTFNPASYAIEAENFDFNGGQFIDNPVITSTAAANSYFDRIGTDGVDSSYGDILTPPTAPFRWRSADITSTDVCPDTKTRALVAAQLTDPLAFNYNIAYWATNAWLNYSHTYPAGNFRIYARVAGETGLTNSIQLDKIAASSTNYLGTFTGVGRGYSLFDWVPLVNTNTSQIATVTLGGLATLRTTSTTGNINPNSYLLVPAVTVPETLQHSYSAGVLTLTWADAAFHLQVQTHAPGTGLDNGWVNYPGGASSPVQVTNNPASGAVFFRLSN
jgi:hypothetical protein